jgi:ankyrin repeat protein
MAAAFYHQEKIVDLLLKEYQVNPNQIHPEHGRTALIYAAQEGYLYIAKTLIKYNANPTIKCVEGKTAHDYALENGHDEVAHYLEGIQNEQRAQADFLK